MGKQFLRFNQKKLLKIRFSRRGKKSQPSYFLVVQEHTSPVKGKFIEKLGHYQPSMPNKPLELDLDRVNYWLSVGAQPSPTAASALKKQGVKGMEKFIAPEDRKRPKKNPSEEEQAAAAPAEEAPAAPEAPKEEVKEEATE